MLKNIVFFLLCNSRIPFSITLPIPKYDIIKLVDSISKFLNSNVQIGGYDGTERLNTIEVYNPDDDTWNAIEPMKERRSGAGKHFIIVNRLINLGKF